eukprot:scpid109807/ scgid30492/ 
MIGHFAMKFLVKGTPLRTCRCAVSHQASAGSAHDLYRTPHVLFIEAKNHTNTLWVEVAMRSMENTRQTYQFGRATFGIMQLWLLIGCVGGCGKAKKFLSCVASVCTAAEE